MMPVTAADDVSFSWVDNTAVSNPPTTSSQLSNYCRLIDRPVVEYQKGLKRYEIENIFLTLRFTVYQLKEELEKMGPLDMKRVDLKINETIDCLYEMVKTYNELKDEEEHGSAV